MAEPRVISREQVWINSQNKEVPPPAEGIPILGWGGSNQDAKFYEISTYDNGQVWSRVSPDGGKTWDEPTYIETDPQLATQYRSDQVKGDSDIRLVDTNAGQVPMDLSSAPQGVPIPGTGPAPGALHYGTDPATGATTVYDPATGQTKPISAGKPVVPAAPDIQIINGNAYRVEPNGNMTLVQDKTLTPGYQAPAAPQGPAYSGTEPGIRLTNELDIAKQKLGSDLDLSRSLVVQGQQFELNTIRDKAQADQRTAEALAQSEQAMAAKAAERDALRADLIWKLQNGVIVTPEADAALKQWDAMNTADYQAHAKRVLDIEDYNRNLPQLQAQEDRAARQDQRETNAPKVAALKGQADAGMSAADRMVKLGVSPSDASLRMAYDPYPRMWAILNEKPAAAPQLQTQVAPAAPTARPMPNIVPSFLQVAPSAPGAAVTAPPAPYGGDANAQAAFEGQYPGQDAEEIWRQQRAANGGR